MPCGHGLCMNDFQMIGGTLKPNAGDPGRTSVEDAEHVEYVDTDGDAIAFRLNASGRLDYYVNGRQKVHDLTRLTADGRRLHIDGSSSGPWQSRRATTVPQGQETAIARVMSLFSNRSSGAVPTSTVRTLAVPSSIVEYVDTDGDAIAFRLNASGHVDYYVNDQQKVHDLTKLIADGRRLHLDGTSSGSWGSSRATTVPVRGGKAVVASIIALFNQRAA